VLFPEPNGRASDCSQQVDQSILGAAFWCWYLHGHNVPGLSLVRVHQQRRLGQHDGAFTGAAAIAWPANAFDVQDGRHHVQHLADVIADHMQLALAVGASQAFRLDQHFLSEQIAIKEAGKPVKAAITAKARKLHTVLIAMLASHPDYMAS